MQYIQLKRFSEISESKGEQWPIKMKNTVGNNEEKSLTCLYPDFVQLFS